MYKNILLTIAAVLVCIALQSTFVSADLKAAGEKLHDSGIHHEAPLHHDEKRQVWQFFSV
jgi:hypothetical protein